MAALSPSRSFNPTPMNPNAVGNSNDFGGHNRGGSAGSIQMLNANPSGIQHPSQMPNNQGAAPPAFAFSQQNPQQGAMPGGAGGPPMTWIQGPNGQPMQVPVGQAGMAGGGVMGQGGMYGQQQQQQMGCCGPDQNPNQPGMFSTCCPTDPTVHICDTTYHVEGAPGTNAQNISVLNCLWNYCDATTWTVVVFFFMCVVGFAVSVGTSNIDDLYAVYSVSNSAELDLKIFNEGYAATNPETYTGVVESEDRCQQLCWFRNKSLAQQVTQPPLFTSSNTTAESEKSTTTVTALPDSIKRTSSGSCPLAFGGGRQDKLTGLIGGDICEYHAISPTAMLINLSRWNNFRGTLYFIAMMGCLTLLTMIILINRHRISVPNGGVMPAISPPYEFWKTNFYYMFRFAWGVVSVIIFLWVATEMYQFWWFKDMYIGQSRGALQDFWVAYSKKLEGSVICVTIFLCWPMIQLVASLGFFIAFLVPWMCFKNMCYPQLQMLQWQREKLPKHEDDESFCVSAEMFFSQYRQLGRLGFSQGIWELMTTTTEPYTTCGEQQQGMFGGAPGQPMNPQMMQQMMMMQQQQQQAGGAMPPQMMSNMTGNPGAAGFPTPSTAAGGAAAHPPAGHVPALSASSSMAFGRGESASQGDAFNRSGNMATSRGAWSDAGSLVEMTGEKVKKEKSKKEKSKKEKGDKREKRDKSRDKRDKSGSRGPDSGLPPPGM